MSSIVALDVGGTSIKAGVVATGAVGTPGLRSAGAGSASDAVTMGPPVPTRSTEAAEIVLDQLTEAVSSSLAIADSRVAGLAIAFPGPFDIAGGRALIRGLHKFESIYGLDLRAALHARLAGLGSATVAVPIEFARDSESAGTGEVAFGSGRSGHRVLTVTIGTGLGACLTADGAVVEMVGDLEIEKLAQRSTPNGRADDVLSARGLADRLGVATPAIRSLAGDPSVRDAIEDHGHRLGTFLSPVVDELEVDLVVIGGGLVAAFDLFGTSLRSALGTTRCEPAMLGAAGPLLGAALLTFPHRFPSPR
jgi:glucokinase